MPEPDSRPRRTRSKRVPGGALRAGTRRAVRASGPPTVGIPVWTAPDGVDRHTAQAVIDLAMRAGVALLATGAAAADVVATVLRLTGAYGLRSVHVDVTFTSVTVSYHRGPSADPITVMRIVRGRVQDFTRLERLRTLVDELVATPVGVEDARVRFDSVIQAPHPYRRWVVTSATGTLAAAAAVLLGGGPLIAVISFLTAAAVDRAQHVLRRARVAAFFTQCVASAIPTVVATAVGLAQPAAPGLLRAVSPSLIVAAGIVVLLSGLSVVGSAQDAIEGFYVTAGARVFEVIVLTLGIVVGITTVLALGHRAGLPMTISAETDIESGRVVQTLAAVVIAGSFAIASYAVGRAAAVAGLAGGMGWLILLLLIGSGAGRPTASAVAALVAGFLARALAGRLRVSAVAVTTASIVPLLPGRAVYQGIFEIVASPSGVGLTQGFGTLLGAAGIGLGLAAGVSLGTYLAGTVQVWRSGRPLSASNGAPGAASEQAPT